MQSHSVRWIVESHLQIYARLIRQPTSSTAKGYYHPTLPLKASLHPITDVDIPRIDHTICIVKGRAYIFGGKSKAKDGVETLAENDVQVVILPSSGVETSDYKRIAPSDKTPPPRYGHCACTIGDSIFVFGGSEKDDGEPIDEQGRVWMLDTTTERWTDLEPAAVSKRPEPRINAASEASEHPQPVQRRTDEGFAPQMEIDPAKIVPEPPKVGSYGTLITQGGRGSGGQILNDMWSFDLSTRTWTELPEPPPPITEAPSMAMIEKRIYAFSRGQVSYIDLTLSPFSDNAEPDEIGLTPLGPWSSLPPPNSSPDMEYPADRTRAGLMPVTTGQGRDYLLLFGGISMSGETLQDIWTLQLKPKGNTSASLKDAVKRQMSNETLEGQWQEVKYCDSEGVLIQESQPGRGIGVRRGLAAAKGTEVDGATVVVWGGTGVDEQIRGDGVMITVDR